MKTLLTTLSIVGGSLLLISSLVSANNSFIVDIEQADYAGFQVSAPTELQEIIGNGSDFAKLVQLENLLGNETADENQVQFLMGDLFGDYVEEQGSDMSFGFDLAEQQYWEAADKIITEEERNTLSMKAIDEKLQRAGLDSLGDSRDPLYSYSVKQIENLSDAEREKIDDVYADLYGEFEFSDDFFVVDMDPTRHEINSLITEDDWNTLSMKEIDDKLENAGLEPMGFENDPLYTMKPIDIQNLTDAEWNAIENEMAAVYETDLFFLEECEDGQECIFGEVEIFDCDDDGECFFFDDADMASDFGNHVVEIQ